jgi:hypothetical protein
VSWTAPTDTGGSAITNYRVTSSPGSFIVDVSGNVTTGTVTGLTNGTPYTFTVIATNTQGNSIPSTPSAPVTPATVPDAPTSVSGVSDTNANVSVSWAAPDNNGGSAITSYTVTSTPGSFTVDVSGDILVALFTTLTNGTSYTFTVIATNIAGDSLESIASDAVIPLEVPSTVPITSSSPGNGTATINWSTPISNGGTEITSYRINYSQVIGGFESNIGQFFVSSSTFTYTVLNLTNGGEYALYVYAVNSVGTSGESERAVVVPSA